MMGAQLSQPDTSDAWYHIIIQFVGVAFSRLWRQVTFNIAIKPLLEPDSYGQRLRMLRVNSLLNIEHELCQPPMSFFLGTLYALKMPQALTRS
jgi:hypothetical protein